MRLLVHPLDTHGERQTRIAPAMAEAAQDLHPDEPDNIVALPGADAPIGVKRKAEGGLSLHFTFDIPKLPNLTRVTDWTHQQMINGGLIVVVALLAGWTIYQAKFAPAESPAVEAKAEEPANLRPNVATTFNADVNNPVIGAETYVDKLASVIGDVTIGKQVFVAPFASIRGDEGQPIVVGDGSNVQDGVVIHALETTEDGKAIEKNLVTVSGKKYAVYVGKGVSLAHQSQVHGPAAVGDHTFVGMQALVFKSVIGKNVVIEPGAKVIGVTIAEKRYVPAGSTITTQAQADALPEITPDYAFATLNDGVLHVNEQFADAYLKLEEAGPTGETAAEPKSGH
jgi:carbonic anhydrase/acetyltransferase-like protein (isoleucine patch superfamily)